ncbi:Hypothetical protein CINCED_3A014652 [Cinara cedri]|nr:Hypothetical protein CINCED_3A014652 [Cinara cedri]
MEEVQDVLEGGAFDSKSLGKTHDSEEQEIWYDALEEQEEFFDTYEYIESDNIQGVAKEKGEDNDLEYISNQGRDVIVEKGKCESGQYYSLQSGMKEKKEIDNTTKTLALAFQIDMRKLYINNNINFSTLKLQKIQNGGDEYYLYFIDNSNNFIMFCTKSLNIYFPKHFEKRYGKSCAEIFPEREYNVCNHIIIPLEVQKEVSILTHKSWNPIKSSIQSNIPEINEVDLQNCDGHMNFHFDVTKSNNIHLSLTSNKIKTAAIISGTPLETNWLIKDILIRGSFANQIGVNKMTEIEVDRKRFKVNSVQNCSNHSSNRKC